MGGSIPEGLNIDWLRIGGNDITPRGYPDCVIVRPILIGDGWCHDGEYNTDACGYDDKDCLSSYCPVYDVEHLGDGVCNEGTYNTYQCGHDAGDCKSIEHFPGCGSINIDNTDDEFGDGICNLKYNTPQCGFDGLDCIEFNADYPLCDVDDPPEIGDGFCFGAEEYNNINCDFDGDDCLRFMKDYPNCQVEEPDRVGDGECDGGSYYTPECGWDGGDCVCRVDPVFLGDGRCDGWIIPESNTIECGWDGGDCFIDGLPPPEWWNNDPDCHVEWSQWIGDGWCDGGAYNTPECGWDGGDCILDDYPDCHVD